MSEKSLLNTPLTNDQKLSNDRKVQILTTKKKKSHQKHAKCQNVDSSMQMMRRLTRLKDFEVSNGPRNDNEPIFGPTGEIWSEVTILLFCDKSTVRLI